MLCEFNFTHTWDSGMEGNIGRPIALLYIFAFLISPPEAKNCWWSAVRDSVERGYAGMR